MSDAAPVILAISTLVVAITGLLGAITIMIVNLRATRKVQREVQTLNEQTIGQLGAAEETRRIRDILPGERTPREERHLKGEEDIYGEGDQ